MKSLDVWSKMHLELSVCPSWVIVQVNLEELEAPWTHDFHVSKPAAQQNTCDRRWKMAPGWVATVLAFR